MDRRGFAWDVKNLLLLLLSLLLSLAVAEGVLRIIRPEYRYAVEGKFVENHFRIWDNPRNSRNSGPHPDLDEEHLIIYNALGFRQHREFTSVKPQNTLRIGFFGDSMTSNILMPAQFAFTEPLNYLLNKAGLECQVMNFGVDGYGTGQSYLKYLEQGVQLDLDLVIYVYSNNDLRNIKENNLFTIGEQDELIALPPLSSSPAVQFIKRFYLTYLIIDTVNRFGVNLEHRVHEHLQDNVRAARKRRFHHPDFIAIQDNFATGSIDRDVRRTLAIFDAIIGDMKRQVAQNDARFHVMTLPSGADRRMDDYLVSRGFSTIKMSEPFSQHYQGREFRFINDFHWNEEGNKTAAVYLFAFLAEEFNLQYDGNAFIEQGLYEYYSSFERPERRLSPLFVKQHALVLQELRDEVKRTYLGLEHTISTAAGDAH